jgi:hypothetical protein
MRLSRLMQTMIFSKPCLTAKMAKQQVCGLFDFTFVIVYFRVTRIVFAITNHGLFTLLLWLHKMNYAAGGLRYFKHVAVECDRTNEHYPRICRMPPLESNPFLQMIHRDPGCPFQLKEFLEHNRRKSLTWGQLTDETVYSIHENMCSKFLNQFLFKPNSL